MKSFDKVYKIVEESSHETAFNKEECRALYNLLSDFDTDSNVVEIGVEFGRSTTVIAELANEMGFYFLAIDNWSGEYGGMAKDHVLSQKNKYDWDFNLWSMDSLKASKKYYGKIDLIHIDGDHSYEAVLADCEAWLPKVKKGGYACFDDWNHAGLPGVYRACKEYLTEDKWKFIGQYGEKLGVYQKL